jgi:hypothetical protein
MGVDEPRVGAGVEPFESDIRARIEATARAFTARGRDVRRMRRCARRNAGGARPRLGVLDCVHRRFSDFKDLSEQS